MHMHTNIHTSTHTYVPGATPGLPTLRPKLKHTCTHKHTHICTWRHAGPAYAKTDDGQWGQRWRRERVRVVSAERSGRAARLQIQEGV